MNRFKQIIRFSWMMISVWMLSGCHSRQDTLFKATKEHASSDEIRKAALPLFSKYHYNSINQNDMVVPFKEIPKEIKSLPVFSKIPQNNLFILTAWAGTNDSALLFVAGSGFGHWGIAVCKDENDREFDKSPSYTYWKNGVYFYDGP